MKIDIGAVINDPSISPDTRVEVNFSELLKLIFNKEETMSEENQIFLNNLTYLN